MFSFFWNSVFTDNVVSFLSISISILLFSLSVGFFLRATYLLLKGSSGISYNSLSIYLKDRRWSRSNMLFGISGTLFLFSVLLMSIFYSYYVY